MLSKQESKNLFKKNLEKLEENNFELFSPNSILFFTFLFILTFKIKTSYDIFILAITVNLLKISIK